MLVLVLAMGSCVTHGVRATPSASGSADNALLPPGPGCKMTQSAGQAPASRQERQGQEEEEQTQKEAERAVTGSRLPDCEHACGPCAPCKRVMVSFRCALASESCPVAYRCMCRGRFFRVPTLSSAALPP